MRHALALVHKACTRWQGALLPGVRLVHALPWHAEQPLCTSTACTGSQNFTQTSDAQTAALACTPGASPGVFESSAHALRLSPAGRKPPTHCCSFAATTGATQPAPASGLAAATCAHAELEPTTAFTHSRQVVTVQRAAYSKRHRRKVQLGKFGLPLPDCRLDSTPAEVTCMSGLLLLVWPQPQLRCTVAVLHAWANLLTGMHQAAGSRTLRYLVCACQQLCPRVRHRPCAPEWG